MGRDQKKLLIGDLAQVTGVATKTIRFYEESGVLPLARRATNGYRVYDGEDVRRLRFIRNARELDFTLDQLKAVIGQRERGQARCVHVIELLAAKMAELEERIQYLQELRGDLKVMLSEAQDLPTDDVAMERCLCSLIHTR